MMDDVDIFWSGFAIGVIVGMLSGIAVHRSDWRSETIQRGLAIYCPADGDWAWNGECDQ